MELVKGILELHQKGFGLLRNPANNFNPTPQDVYVSPSFIQKLRLKPGLEIEGRPGETKEQNQMVPLAEIVHINGGSVDEYFKTPALRKRVVIDPLEQLTMKQHPRDKTGSVIDILTPIGKGQRGLIVSPPKAGKTIILKHLANSVLMNHPDMHVMILLVDERPEEVTDFKRNVNCEVFHSDVDESIENHIRMTELVLERAVHLAEYGKDVVLFVDSLTRMGRAFNANSKGTGRTLTGGLDARALEFPRRFFGSARNLEEGGSLAIVATILVETGSQMDQIIFQEFKGTGNMELVLSRELSDRRIFPAVDLNQSGTRKEEKLLSPESLQKSYIIRKTIHDMQPVEALGFAIKECTKEPAERTSRMSYK